MVDPKNTNERTFETGAGLGQVALKVWAKPRLESLDIAVDTANTATHTTNDGVATSMS
jgi:hypothetical protein